MSTLYVPVECTPTGCSLRPELIGQAKASAIAAIYRGPGSNLSAARKKAGLIVGRELADTSFRRHIDHLRMVNDLPARPDEGDKIGTPLHVGKSIEEVLDILQLSHSIEPDAFWQLAISAVEDSGEHWREALEEAMEDLDTIDYALTFAA